jgi:hypothetical protein
MKVLFAGQIPKDYAYPEDIEDTYAVSMATGTVAVSDGASESFDSKAWAKLLVKGYVGEPKVSIDWVRNRIDEYNCSFDMSSLSWSRMAAYERGSFATLFGFQHMAESSVVDLFAIGDTFAAFCDGVELVDAFPYSRSEEFEERPELISTKVALNIDFESPEFLLQRHRTWSTAGKQAPSVLFMTDALAQWALKSAEKGSSAWERLLGITELSMLEVLVLEEREAKNMRVDDVTLVCVSLDECERDAISIP